MSLFDKYAMMPMQKYYDCTNKEKSYTTKVDVIRKDVNHNYIASEKHDGEASMFIKIDGKILIRSRNLSKVTGKYGDYTEKIPHLVDELSKFPDNTVFLAELCLNDGTNHSKKGAMSTDVGTVLRSLPPRAIEEQRKKGKLVAVVYDCLMYDGVEIMNGTYESRVRLIIEKFDDEFINTGYIYHTQYKYDDFYDFFDNVINNCGEGLVLVMRDYPYSPDKRTTWKTLKWKRHTEELDLLVVDTEDFTKEYTGKSLATWKYFVDEYDNKIYANSGTDKSKLTPVTKGWFYGWKAAVICEYNGQRIRVASGLSDNDRGQLAEEHMQEHIRNKELYAEVSGMQSATKGKIRHPILNRLRLF